MQRTIFTARSARSLTHALRIQTRRTFATPQTKDTTPPDPIDRSKQQAHPIGAYYDAIMANPQPIPAEKPEQPPTSSPKSSVPPPSPAPAAPAPAPAKRGRKPKEPKSATSPSSTSAPPPPPSSSIPVFSSAVPDPASSSSTSSSASASAPASSAVSSSSPPTSGTGSNVEVQARARIVFGSRLAGPEDRAKRLAAARQRSRLVAGVLVPPKPAEPDNCCMSGCVNCVWDLYRDEMEEWAAATAEAEARLRAQEAGVGTIEESMVATTQEDSGDKESTDAWRRMGVANPPTRLANDFWDEELYKNVPVGIREFMKQEKKLKEKHAKEGSIGG